MESKFSMQFPGMVRMRLRYKKSDLLQKENFVFCVLVI